MSVPHLLHHLALGQDVWRAKSFSALDANFVQVEDLAESLRTSIDKDATYRDAIIARILEQEAPAFGFNSTDIQVSRTCFLRSLVVQSLMWYNPATSHRLVEFRQSSPVRIRCSSDR